MSDFELVRTFRERLDAIWQAYCGYRQADNSSERNAKQITKLRNEVDRRNAEAREAVNARLDALAAAHPVLQEALRVREELPSPSAQDAEQRYAKIPKCVERLQNEVEPRSRNAEPQADRARPLSRLDLPSVIDAVNELYRAIETPPPNAEMPHHVRLIRAACANVRKALKLKGSVNEWTNEVGRSPFDDGVRLALVKLCNLMADIIYYRSMLTVDAGKSLTDLATLQTVLADLEPAEPQANHNGATAATNEVEGADDGLKVKKRKKPGPKKARHNIANDKKIFDQWERGHRTGDFPTYAECDNTHKHPLGTTKAAVARHRGRERNAQ
jgi:hypothetical protein